MKKILLLIPIMLLAGVMLVCGQAFRAKKLPAKATTFINKYFPDSRIRNLDIDREDGVIKDYEVLLNNGDEITFDSNGVWQEVDMHLNRKLPTGFLPDPIMKYVKDKYDSEHITGVENEPYGYDVKLSNRLDLKFDKVGKFLGIDM